MEALNEKKWFMYVGDHHEGPFSLSEIRSKLDSGVVTPQSFVWTEGMADWKAMNEVPSFAPILAIPDAVPGSPPLLPSGPPEVPFVEDILSSNSEEPAFEAPTLEPASGTPSEMSDDSSHHGGADQSPQITLTGANDHEPSSEVLGDEVPIEEDQLQPGSPSRKMSSKIVKIAIMALIPVGVGILIFTGALNPLLKNPGVQAVEKSIGDALRPTAIKLASRFPALGNYLSPLPRLDDVEESKYAQLKQAVLTPLEPGKGAKIALALSKSDLESPQFYVAGNLPDGTFIEVSIVGISDTLLNTTSFSGSAKGTLVDKLAKVGPIKSKDGHAIPRGQYDVYAYEADSQPTQVATALTGSPQTAVVLPETAPKGRKLAAKETVFLGGPEDATYALRLKEFHEKTKSAADNEIREVGQFAATLEQNLKSTVESYNNLKGLKNKKAQKVSWNDFHASWAVMEGQLQQSFQKWSPDVLQNEYFYGVLYQYTLSAALAIAKLHQLHHAFFSGTADMKSFDIQVGEATSLAEGEIAKLKTKIDQIKALPLSPGGMPRKDGV